VELTAAWRRGGAPDDGSLPKKLEAARLKARRSRCSRMAVLRRWPALGLTRKEAGTGMAQAWASSAARRVRTVFGGAIELPYFWVSRGARRKNEYGYRSIRWRAFFRTLRPILVMGL
jgi:hypothetical protein